jgi:hypothetical protein
METKSTKTGDIKLVITQNSRASRITLNVLFPINMIDVYRKYVCSPNSNPHEGPNAVYIKYVSLIRLCT